MKEKQGFRAKAFREHVPQIEFCAVAKQIGFAGSLLKVARSAVD
jgi:hypothetical protein